MYQFEVTFGFDIVEQCSCEENAYMLTMLQLVAKYIDKAYRIRCIDMHGTEVYDFKSF